MQMNIWHLTYYIQIRTEKKKRKVISKFHFMHSSFSLFGLIDPFKSRTNFLSLFFQRPYKIFINLYSNMYDGDGKAAAAHKCLSRHNAMFTRC